jgi:hypothetical protein
MRTLTGMSGQCAAEGAGAGGRDRRPRGLHEDMDLPRRSGIIGSMTALGHAAQLGIFLRAITFRPRPTARRRRRGGAVGA